MSYIEVTSALVLHADPVESNHAATKRYVDGKKSAVTAQSFTTGIIPVGRMTALTGDIASAEGSGVATLSVNGVVAGSHPKITIDSAGRVTTGTTLSSNDIPNIPFSRITTGKPTTAAGYGINNLVPLSGGAVTGPITSTATPSANLDAVTKGYADSALTGIVSGTLAVGDIVRKPLPTAPSGFLRCNGGYVDKSVYADLFGVVGYSLLTKVNLDYTSYAAVGAGRPWEQQYDFNTTQTSDIAEWLQSGSLQYTLRDCLPIVTKNRIYLIGGLYSGSASSSVLSAVVNSDGTLGTFSNYATLPGSLYNGSSCVVTKNLVYLLGGLYSGSSFTRILKAVINSDGTLGSFAGAGDLPADRQGSKAVVVKNKVYLIGGVTYNGATSTVLVAPINADGTIGSWSQAGNFPGTITDHSVAVTKNKLHVIAGSFNSGETAGGIYTTTINSDGTLGTWALSQNVPGGESLAQIFVCKNKVYLIGGASGTKKIYVGTVDDNGEFTSWTTQQSLLPVTIYLSCLVAVKGKIYLIGGSNGTGDIGTIYSAPISGGLNDYTKFYDGSINKFDGSNVSGEITVQDQTDMGHTQPGNGQPWRQQYDINTTQSGDITGWRTDGGLPGLVGDAQVVVTKNKVHLLGGVSGVNYSQSIFSGVIDAGGNIGQWAISATLLPKTIAESQAVVTKNRVHLLGGRIEGSFSSTVYTAPINTDGTLGTWGTGTQLTGNSGQAAAVVTRNSVYLIGGVQSGNYTANIQAATINTDGTLGVWLNVGSLPAPVASASVIVTKNRIYLLGGYNNSGYLNTIYSCSINSDGTLGNWTTSVPLPVIMREFQTVVTRNAVYLLGGMYGSSSSETYYAPINSDGTLGTWRLSVSLSTSLGKSQVVATKNKIYLLGGYAGGSYNSVVYSAPFSGGLNDYSPYYDGTIVAAEPTQFKLPDFTTAETSGVNYYIKY